MLFNSLEFAIFLPIVFFLYWFATNKNLRNQNLLIVAASLLFYGWWDWRFLLLMVVTITLSYLSGLAIRQVRSNREEHSARRGARLVTALNITLNLAILGTFKYYNFFVDSFVDAFSLFGRELSPRTLQVILPVGISFYTFQALSYTIDVYRPPLRHQPDAQLRLPLLLARHRRVLATVAHLAHHLVPRLPLHPAGREPRHPPDEHPQHLRHLPCERLLARCQLDLPHLGSA